MPEFNITILEKSCSSYPNMFLKHLVDLAFNLIAFFNKSWNSRRKFAFHALPQRASLALDSFSLMSNDLIRSSSHNSVLAISST